MIVAEARSRSEGCLPGLAVGDALGAPLGFHRRERITPIIGMIEGGKFRMRRGEWTDDTAMALCLAGSLLARGGLEAAYQRTRYWRLGNGGKHSLVFFT
ncbi:MAG: ADP-ribosylglycohydrolase family protein [Pseudomonadota bacterium]